MQKSKNLRILFAILSALSLSGCGSVTIKNAEWCADMGELGASCFHTVSDDARELSKEEWDALRFGQVCTGPDNFANWKAAILKFCSRTKICSFDFKKKVIQFTDKMNRMGH